MSRIPAEIEVPPGVRIQVAAWGQSWPCEIRGRTLCFHGGMVPRDEQVMVFARQEDLDDAEEVAIVLRKWGWKRAESRIDKGDGK